MNSARPRIAIDAMGGDQGAAVTVPGALALLGQAQLRLVGDPAVIAAELQRAGVEGVFDDSLDAARSQPVIVPAFDRLLPGEPLNDVLRHRPDTSMRRALEEVAEGRADAVVSAGDTAALMALARRSLKPLPDVHRPAICKAMQGVAGPFWMLDLGANLECTAQELVQFARMGAELARAVGGVTFPRVALLNIGTEPTKGPAHIRAAAELFKNDSGFSYAGFIEANRLFRGEADVVVADGFAGNIALKAMEGAAWMAGQLLRRSFEGIGLIEQAGLAMARTRIRSLRRELNPERYNGASLVGLAGVVVKSHGGADQEGFASAVQEAVHEVEAGLVARLGNR